MDLERELGERLRAIPGGSPDQAADQTARASAELSRRWEKNLFSAAEQVVAARFFLAAKQRPRLLELISQSLGAGRSIPWGALAQALSPIVPRPAEAEALVAGVEESGAVESFLRSAWPDGWSSSWADRFAVERSGFHARTALQLEDKRAQLWDAVRFMRANRLFEQESMALQELRAMFPDDAEFASQNQSLQERWAREIIAQSHDQGQRRGLARAGESAREEAEREAPPTAEEGAIRDIISVQALALARSRPERAVDFSLLLHFMEFESEAIQAIQATSSPDATAATDALRAKPDPSRDWLRFELLLLARQFVTALDEAARLESLYSDDPDAAFAVAYGRARAFWGLGESAMALELIGGLVAVRPRYRSAQSLLHDWSGGDRG